MKDLRAADKDLKVLHGGVEMVLLSLSKFILFYDDDYYYFNYLDREESNKISSY